MNVDTTRLGRRRLGALAILLALCGCGGGGSLASSGDGGISGTGMAVGSVTGFGSVFVNGTEFDTSAAAIVVDGNGATQNDLRVGQIVVVNANFSDGKASRVEYRARIKGPIQALTVQDASVAAATLTVLGQPVTTNSATNLSGASIDPTAASPLAVGDLVEISGLTNANGALIATFVERKAALSEYQVVGTVANVTATTFHIGALTVDYSATNASPRNGDNVVVTGAANQFSAASTTLAADRVESISVPMFTTSDRGELEGYITRFASASDFDVNGVRAAVDSQTAYQGGSASNLALNVKVELRGVVNTSGVLVASSVEFESTGSIRIEGSIEQIDTNAARVTVLQVPVKIGAGTHLEDHSSANVNPLTLADLAVADRVEVRAFLDGSTVVASELERQGAGPAARLRGRVTSIDATAFQLAILGVTINVDGSTQYEGAENRDAFFATVRIGDFVEAEWDDFAAAAPADELALEDD